VVREIRNGKGTGRMEAESFDGLHGADGKEGESVENEPGDAKLVGQVMDPGV